MPSEAICRMNNLVKLIHGIVFAAGFQCSFTGKVFFVVVANVRTGHVLVFHTSNTVADLLALYVFHICQHAVFRKVAFGQSIGRKCGCVVSRQSNQVVEDTCFC